LMPAATCNSLPVAEVDRIIPGGENIRWVIGYPFFEFEALSIAKRLVSFIGAAAAAAVGWKHSISRLVEKRRITPRCKLRLRSFIGVLEKAGSREYL
jgi:hypothetical protein